MVRLQYVKETGIAVVLLIVVIVRGLIGERLLQPIGKGINVPHGPSRGLICILLVHL